MVREGLCIFLIHNKRMSVEVHSIFVGKFTFRALKFCVKIVDNSETLRKRKADCAQGAGATKDTGEPSCAKAASSVNFKKIFVFTKLTKIYEMIEYHC